MNALIISGSPDFDLWAERERNFKARAVSISAEVDRLQENEP
jgi:hypothetical protein